MGEGEVENGAFVDVPLGASGRRRTGRGIASSGAGALGARFCASRSAFVKPASKRLARIRSTRI